MSGHCIPAHIGTYAWRVFLVLLVSGSGNDRTEELVLRVEAGHAGRPKGRKVTSLIVFPEPTLQQPGSSGHRLAPATKVATM